LYVFMAKAGMLLFRKWSKWRQVVSPSPAIEEIRAVGREIESHRGGRELNAFAKNTG
jgi:hypothetical protein